MYMLTGGGANIRVAQYIFMAIYITQLLLTFRLYSKLCSIPPYTLLLTTLTSYRIHSIYILRLFNDPIAILFLYLALNSFIDHNWNRGAVFYSLSVSIKMNTLLLAPALFILFISLLPMRKVVSLLSICAFIQILVAFPFLVVNPAGYVQRSFDFSRIFDHKWTVNYRFISTEIFTHQYFHWSLLVCHITTLVLFTPRFLNSFSQYQLTRKRPRCLLLLLPLFVSNLIGMCFARSLHYQFYCWYFHSLPLLVHSTPYSVSTRLLLLGLIELCWNVYPSTVASSLTLHGCHVLLLVGIYRFMDTNNSKFKK